jgi:hypothetical protein
MRHRISQGEGRTPRAAEHDPLVDAEHVADPLHVLDEVPRRVVGEVRVRRRAPAAALVEQHDAVLGRVEELPVPGLDAAARAAVHEDDRLALRVAALLDVQLVHRRHLQAVRAKGLDRGIGLAHGILWRREAGMVREAAPAGQPRRSTKVLEKAGKNRTKCIAEGPFSG